MGWNRVLVTLAFLAFGAPAFAQHAEDARVMARDRYQAGEAKFRAGDFRGAIAEFRAADLLLPAPMNSYNIALAHERLNELDRAAQAYREYLTRRPDAPNRAAVEARISALEATFRPAPAPAPAPVPAPEAPPVTRAPYDPALARRVPDRSAPVETSPEPQAQPQPYPPPQAQQPAYPPAPEPQPQKASRPFYKHWAFWVVVGVGAIILIDIAAGNSGTDEATPVMNQGAVIFRF